MDILGFKSFANKTTVKFSSGVTAIVGPNGCGKTNILDAMRWVLGEQRISLLRGSKMEEVIFNGTRDQKPLGMAEVTLTMVNDRGVLPIEYTEIQITRRLFRSGDSEYLMNKVPCRLKDITELFFDTGVGAHSYSVIQQDMIEAVISDKAEERRFLFEEAAGITKYKQRKRAALRKLEATEQDLLRLQDIYGEVKTRVNSLKRQFKKAERYQQVKEDIRNWELYLGSKRLKGVEQEKRELKSKLDTLSDTMAAGSSEIDRFAANLESNRKDQVDIEHELNRVGNQVYEISERAHELETEISVLKEKKANAQNLIERNKNDIDALQARSEILREQTAGVQGELNEHKAAFESVSRDFETATIKQAEIDRLLLEARASKDRENSRLIELEGKLSSGRTEEENLKAQEDELKETLEQLQSARQTEENRLNDLKARLEAARSAYDATHTRKEESEKDQIEYTRQLEEAVEESESLTNELFSLNASLEGCQARKELLEDMILHFEGHDSGVVSVMEERERWPGISGTVAEKFVPVAGMEIALEAALGDIAGFLVCDNRTTAENVIKHLKTNKSGRVGILVPDAGMINPVVKRPEITDERFAGWLDTFVSTDDSLRPLMQAVLARIAVFNPTDTTPMDLLERLPYGFMAVSTDGTVYGKNMVTGGSDDSFPLFRRQEKVAEEEKNLVEIRAKIEENRVARSRVTATIGSLRAESANLTSNIENIKEEISACQKTIDQIGYEQKTARSEHDRLDREIKQIQEKLEKIRGRQYSLGLDFNQLADQKKDLMQTLSQSGNNLEDRESSSARASDEVSHLQIRMVEVKSQIEQAESRIRHQNELQQEMSNTVDAKKSEIEQAYGAIQNAEKDIAEKEVTLKEVFESRVTATVQQTSLKEHQTEVLEKITGLEKTVKELRQSREGLNQEMHQRDLRLNTLESEITAILERIRDEYEVDIREIEVARPEAEFDDDHARQHLIEQKDALKQFGAVNLLALEEYNEAAEREQFLNEHLTDLIKAKSDLESTITKINQTAKQLFQEAFAKVQVNFKELFVELFSGGEAEIRLEDPGNPLESNIEIIARPRGKKLLAITMMSGGERALTAISLLFALYLVKPSPYCILDEIDAPLDDANCHRFLKMIRSFSGQTQFIVITHNKITMEAANNLYGVTMDQPGISKLVGVKFNDSETSDDQVGLETGDEESEYDNEPTLPKPIQDRLASGVTAETDSDS